MKMSLAILASLSAVALAAPASATQFNFVYSGDGGLNGASGMLTATANGDGTYTATAGTIFEFGPVMDGSGTLIANPNAPGSTTDAFFNYDDQLLSGQNPLITNAGLLFLIGGQEINIYSNGPGPDTYSLLNQNGTSANGNFSLSQVAGVPEPATWAMMLVGFGMIGFTVRNRRQVRVSYS